ncbi:MAG: LPS export ABC transporter periplasmic protein LptC [Rhodocyclaceae bacterium]
MKNWGSALFPLTILIALSGLTFWLRHAIELPDERQDGKNRHDPDYIISAPQLRKLDKNGQLQYTLNANEIRHYPDDDTTDVTKPVLVNLNTKRPSVTISSERAHVSQDGNQVDFYDDVRILRAATAQQAALLATMPDLVVRPDDEKAFTKSPVLVTQGASWLKGVGMRVDQKTQTYVLESQAVGQFESKHAKKR